VTGNYLRRFVVPNPVGLDAVVVVGREQRLGMQPEQTKQGDDGEVMPHRWMTRKFMFL
jgi:hypothetical protein